ncbi:DegT/DnrJ/EryC1/StrS family aminotransferase [Neobacillus sp. NPDC093127]|uniref:DegT/DnrJ/EryC1/StrS family aminotransferase n=1 Tax=Neobacillus sp. NPDC093127 TaxID=3364296 RepID=UPI00381E1EC0
MTKIPFLRPNLVKKEELFPYLSEIETSRMYSNFGPLNARFEQRVLDEYFDTKGAVTTVNNATIGLILALSQVKRSKAKYVLMPSFTFAATPLAALWCGLEPFFIDINQDDWCMNEKLVSEWLEKLDDQVAAVMPYVAFGTNMNLDFYRKIHESGIPVVIDAAASFGAKEGPDYFGKGFPGCIVYSFHATKSFGVGEGGLVYSANQEIIAEIRRAENFGFSKTRETNLLGINGKISEYTAAIAMATLDTFDKKIKTRQQIHTWYAEELSQKNFIDKGWTLQKTCGEIPYQFMPLCCPRGERNDDIIRSLASQNIEARTYFAPPCHQQQLFIGYPHRPLPVTDEISSRIVSLPLWEEMTNQDVRLVVEGMVPS